MTALADLSITMNGIPAARLRSGPDGALSLTYDPSYLDSRSSVPLSLSLPLADDPHGDPAVARWITSLLPDNPSTLDHWYARAAVPTRTPFGLLSTPIGFDCAGAVQFCPVGGEDRLAERSSGHHRLSAAEVEREVEAVVGDPAAWHPDDIEPYFSLGGHQSKLALHHAGDQWARPFGSVPTTHILKPRAAGGRFVAVAEHLCLSAARRLGLDAAVSRIEQHGANTVLVVTRYDRARRDGRWARIHQEDMCQALGLDGRQKYEHSGGPGMSAIGDLIRRHSSAPDDDLHKFADALVYSWLVINRDAHARNYSLIHAPAGVRLAPLYDINSSLMFRRRRIGEENMAMRYGSTFTVYSAGSREALPNIAARLMIPAGRLIDRAEELAAGLPAAMTAAVEDLPCDLHSAAEVEHFVDAIGRRSTECLRSITAARHTRPS